MDNHFLQGNLLRGPLRLQASLDLSHPSQMYSKGLPPSEIKINNT